MRRRYVYDPITKEMVEASSGQASGQSPYVQGDIEPYVSPIDGAIIGTRRAHEAHKRQHGVIETRELYGAVEAARAERHMRMAGKHPDQVRQRIQTISDAYEHARNQARAR